MAVSYRYSHPFLKTMKCLIKYSLLFLLAACHSPSRQKQQATVNPVQDSLPGALAMDERMASADSLVMVWYDDPFTKDSLQYARYYQQLSTTRPDEISLFTEQLRQPVQTAEKPLPCRNEGKIWMFSRGKILQTVYFAYTKPGCTFLFFIKDGIFCYLEPSSSLMDLLRQKADSLKNKPDQGR